MFQVYPNPETQKYDRNSMRHTSNEDLHKPPYGSALQQKLNGTVELLIVVAKHLILDTA